MDGSLQVGGLPLHPLLVHAVVVLLPLTALALVLAQLWPAARRRLGIVTPLAALLVLVLVPVTILAGESLKQTVGPLPAVAVHEGYGRMLPPWAIALFAVASAQWAWFRWGVRRIRRLARAVFWVLAVASIAVAAGAVTVVVLAGESGSRAVWA